MPRAWTGADPGSSFGDDGATSLGTEQKANQTVTLTRIWIYNTSGASLSGRQAKLWNPQTQTVLQTIDLPAQLPIGWSAHDLLAPLVREAGQRWLVAYQPKGYNALSHGLDADVTSADGAVTSLGNGNATNGNGVFTTIPNGFPNNSFNATFYGVDVEYELGSGEAHPPEIHSVEVGTDNLQVAVMVEATDQEGGILTYTVDWGDGSGASVSTAATATHTYALAGSYGVLVKVTDASNLSAYQAVAVEVSAPVPIVGDPLVMPLARELLACYEDELAKLGENAPAHVGLRPGTVVDFLMSTSDDECCAGLAWVRPAGFYPSSAGFPTQDTQAQKQGTRAWAVTLELGIVRCAPTPDADSIPTNDEWADVTQAVMDAAAAMRRAICCWIDLDPVNRKQRILPGTWTPVAVQGGCVGGMIPVTILGPACDCADAGARSS